MEGKYGKLRVVEVGAFSTPGGQESAFERTLPAKWDDDEPLFLIRGQDKLAVEALFAYALLARAHRCHAVALGVDQQMRQVREWQRQHPERTKLPD